ncbi:flavin reductase family protein [Rhodocista pekingensis]|uniref:Flavin reductase family protein n=1 Tax=Rhodocista pekingensis TaxID=201185 RepID=A0ABW2KQE1_9PROT
MSFDARSFRDALGCFATGVCVATTRDIDGTLIGVTVNSFTSVSLDPPLVLFCLNRSAESLGAFERSDSFALTMLAEHEKHLSDGFARLPMPERWSAADFETWQTGSPVLTGGLAAMECVTHARHDGGDHVIMVGRVVKLAHRTEGRPLLYFRGRYDRLGG